MLSKCNIGPVAPKELQYQDTQPVHAEPVMLNCGHNFCKLCISNLLDNQEGRPQCYSCPECRMTFQQRPRLVRNHKLGSIVDLFVSSQPGAGEVGIPCTYCVGSVIAAIKTCLLCEASLCPAHLKVHSSSTDHVLTEPTVSPATSKCSVHRKQLKYYCVEHEACICESCTLSEEHQGHQVELVDKILQDKEHQLRDVFQTLNWQKEELSSYVNVLNHSKRNLKEKVAWVTGRASRLICDIRKQVDDLENKVYSVISQQEERVLFHVSNTIQQLEVKADEVCGKMLYLEDIQNIANPLTLIQVPFHDAERVGYSYTGAQLSLDEAAVADVLVESCKKNSAAVLTLPAKNGFKMQEIQLDTNTAGNHVIISDDLKRVTYCSQQTARPDRPEIFVGCQAMSVGSISYGQYYWEVEVSISGDWKIGVAYPSIDRKGVESFIGANRKSWCMSRKGETVTATHHSVSEPVQPIKSIHKYGIYVDYTSGRLSFYQLSEPIRHLYTFNTTFTECLHPAFYVGVQAWVRIIGCTDCCPTNIASI
ncbi:LOW QUALITY PROTEIN: E3 ubiquitin/ISG15 ligase TRIM25-like [Pelodytes ibericus]